jgi:hypothetical protein
MSLLDRLREAQDEPARHRASPWVGPAILSVEQLRAMERALVREMPGYAPIVEPLPVWTPPPVPAPPALDPPAALAPPTIEPLPLWTPPVFASPPPAEDCCPNCGEDVAIDRIDLTANASWLTCRPCGLRWGGSIDRPASDAMPLMRALPAG